jgi:hypothetical protein
LFMLFFAKTCIPELSAARHAMGPASRPRRNHDFGFSSCVTGLKLPSAWISVR